MPGTTTRDDPAAQLLRLADAGLFPRPHADETGFEAAALRAQVGLTDVIKRHTRGEDDISVGEVEFGSGSCSKAWSPTASRSSSACSVIR
jgi:hypothetical protein